MKKFWKEIKKSKGWLYIVGIVFLLLAVSNIHFLYVLNQFANIENVLRLIVGLVIFALWMFISFKLIKSLFRRKIKYYTRICIISVIYSIILLIISTTLGTALDKLGNFSTSKTTYSASIVALKENKAKDISDVKKAKIGMIKDKNSVDGYQIPQEIIKEEKLTGKTVTYDSYPALLDALLEKKIDYVFLPTNYTVMFQSMDAYADLGKTTKIIYTKKKEIANKTSGKGKKLTEPFTVLLMGVDSEEADIRNSAYNGDSLMLITFNPKTLNTTILSIPRDSYVPIACFPNKRKNKITHAAWYGEDCMIKTIEGFTGVTIDYYAKINFKGVVKLVDALGGIDVDVPKGFCEQDSDRNFNNLQCVKAGKQTLNGEQALAWSRHRKSVGFDDFVRGQNQQLVVKGILNKAKSIRSLDKVYELLDSLGHSMETNMSRDEILSLYNIGKDILLKSQDMPMEDLLSMQRLYLNGYDASIYDYSQIDGHGTGMELYDFVIDKKSLKEVISAMKVNLGEEKHVMVKKFSFDINDPYEESVIGKDTESGFPITYLPSFIGYDQSEAIAFGNKYGITINIKEVAGSTMGQIVNQSLPANMDIEYVRSLTISVVSSKSSDSSSSKKVDCSLKKNQNDDSCQVPNFIGDTYSSVLSWFNAKGYPNVSVIPSFSDGSSWDSSLANVVVSTSPSSGASLYDVIHNGIKVVFSKSDNSNVDIPGSPTEEPEQPTTTTTPSPTPTETLPSEILP